jgi:hypothetical protein
MKVTLKIFLIMFSILWSSNLFSQVTVSIQSLQYTNNGQPTVNAPNCGNIDLGSSTSTSINFGINLA